MTSSEPRGGPHNIAMQLVVQVVDGVRCYVAWGNQGEYVMVAPSLDITSHSSDASAAWKLPRSSFLSDSFVFVSDNLIFRSSIGCCNGAASRQNGCKAIQNVAIGLSNSEQLAHNRLVAGSSPAGPTM